MEYFFTNFHSSYYQVYSTQVILIVVQYIYNNKGVNFKPGQLGTLASVLNVKVCQTRIWNDSAMSPKWVIILGCVLYAVLDINSTSKDVNKVD